MCAAAPLLFSRGGGLPFPLAVGDGAAWGRGGQNGEGRQGPASLGGVCVRALVTQPRATAPGRSRNAARVSALTPNPRAKYVCASGTARRKTRDAS